MASRQGYACVEDKEHGEDEYIWAGCFLKQLPTMDAQAIPKHLVASVAAISRLVGKRNLHNQKDSTATTSLAIMTNNGVAMPSWISDAGRGLVITMPTLLR